MKTKKILMINLIFGLIFAVSSVGLNAETVNGSQGNILAAQTSSAVDKLNFEFVDFDAIKANIIENKDKIKVFFTENKDEIKTNFTENKDEFTRKLNEVFEYVKDYVKENVSVNEINERLLENINNM